MKKLNFEKYDLLTVAIIFLIGVAVAIVVAVLISAHKPIQYKAKCNDGWSTQEKDGKVYRTYVPAMDDCNKK